MSKDKHLKEETPQGEPKQEEKEQPVEPPKEKTPLEKANVKIADLEKTLDDQKEKYKYLQAEFENYQKRTQRQQELWRKQETASIFKKFLPSFTNMKNRG